MTAQNWTVYKTQICALLSTKSDLVKMRFKRKLKSNKLLDLKLATDMPDLLDSSLQTSVMLNLTQAISLLSAPEEIREEVTDSTKPPARLISFIWRHLLS